MFLFQVLFLFSLSALAQHDQNALELAKELVKKIGIQGSGKCNSCHGASIVQAKAWSKQSTTLEWACFKKEGLKPIERVNCFRENPSDPSSPFTAQKLGFYSLYTRSAAFKKLFADAYPDPKEAEVKHKELIDSASMPPVNSGVPPFSDEDTEKIMVWANRMMPLADAVVKPDPEKPCRPFISQELKTHLVKMKTSGWTAKNQEAGMVNFGCGLATDPLKCLTKFPDITSKFSAPGVAQTLRKIHNRSKRSYFWFRGSPDGRYIGFGGTNGKETNHGEMVDLVAANKGANSVVSFEDATDPSFLPDGSGFIFTGLERPLQSVCKISLLQDGLARPGTVYKLPNQQKCATDTEGWYNSWGGSLDGTGYWMIAGNYIADDGQYTEDLPMPANSAWKTDIIRLNEMVNDGLSYRAGHASAVSIKGMVDMMTSPSAKIMNNRFGSNATQSGFEIRTIFPTFENEGGSLYLKKVGEYCGFGSKANFSFDERFLVYHQYPEPWRTGEAKLPAGTSNIVVHDLMTGYKRRITSVPAGYKALFPNFRSDGWIYFIVRSPDAKSEEVVASDFMIRSGMIPFADEE